MSSNPSRRAVLCTGGLALAGVALGSRAPALGGTIDIGMRSDEDGALVWFDPIGVLVDPGTTIRWTIHENVHTATAYHPANDSHALRIPENASPWDSDYLVDPGDTFAITLSVPGVYDYFCAPHEEAGMVGRIVVGEPSGPGAQPFDYFKWKSPPPDWTSVPEAARRNFPSIADIMARGSVHL